MSHGADQEKVAKETSRSNFGSTTLETGCTPRGLNDDANFGLDGDPIHRNRVKFQVRLDSLNIVENMCFTQLWSVNTSGPRTRALQTSIIRSEFKMLLNVAQLLHVSLTHVDTYRSLFLMRTCDGWLNDCLEWKLISRKRRGDEGRFIRNDDDCISWNKELKGSEIERDLVRGLLFTNLSCLKSIARRRTIWCSKQSQVK